MKSYTNFKSNIIEKIKYCDILELLEIMFKYDKNESYVFLNFPKDKFEEFINSDSLGHYYNQYIKGKYEFQKTIRDE